MRELLYTCNSLTHLSIEGLKGVSQPGFCERLGLKLSYLTMVGPEGNVAASENEAIFTQFIEELGRSAPYLYEFKVGVPAMQGDLEVPYTAYYLIAHNLPSLNTLTVHYQNYSDHWKYGLSPGIQNKDYIQFLWFRCNQIAKQRRAELGDTTTGSFYNIEFSKPHKGLEKLSLMVDVYERQPLSLTYLTHLGRGNDALALVHYRYEHRTVEAILCFGSGALCLMGELHVEIILDADHEDEPLALDYELEGNVPAYTGDARIVKRVGDLTRLEQELTVNMEMTRFLVDESEELKIA